MVGEVPIQELTHTLYLLSCSRDIGWRCLAILLALNTCESTADIPFYEPFAIVAHSLTFLYPFVIISPLVVPSPPPATL